MPGKPLVIVVPRTVGSAAAFLSTPLQSTTCTLPVCRDFGVSGECLSARRTLEYRLCCPPRGQFNLGMEVFRGCPPRGTLRQHPTPYSTLAICPPRGHLDELQPRKLLVVVVTRTVKARWFSAPRNVESSSLSFSSKVLPRTHERTGKRRALGAAGLSG